MITKAAIWIVLIFSMIVPKIFFVFLLNWLKIKAHYKQSQESGILQVLTYDNIIRCGFVNTLKLMIYPSIKLALLPNRQHFLPPKSMQWISKNRCLTALGDNFLFIQVFVTMNRDMLYLVMIEMLFVLEFCAANISKLTVWPHWA